MRKEEIQLFLFAEDKIVYAGNPKESTKKFYNKVRGYKINIENENQDKIAPDFCQHGCYQEDNKQ